MHGEKYTSRWDIKESDLIKRSEWIKILEEHNGFNFGKSIGSVSKIKV